MEEKIVKVPGGTRENLEDYNNSALILRIGLIFVTLLSLLLTLYFLFFSFTQQSLNLLDLSSTLPGPWNYSELIYTYQNTERLNIKVDKGTDTKYLNALIVNSKEYCGFGISQSHSVPDNAILNIKWRQKGTLPHIQVDIVDRSPGKNLYLTGEMFSTTIKAPKNKWETLKIDLKNFKKSEFQTPNISHDGIFNTNDIRNIQFTFDPDTEVEIDIKKIGYTWTINLLPFLLLLLVFIVLGIILIFRTSNIEFLLLGIQNTISTAIISRIIFILLSLAMLISLMQSKGESLQLGNIVGLLGIMFVSLFDEFYRGKPVKHRSWQLRYFIIIIIGWLLGFSFNQEPLFLLFLCGYIPLVIKKDWMYFLSIPVIMILFLSFSQNYMGFNSYGEVIVFISFTTLVGIIGFQTLQFKQNKANSEQVYLFYEGILQNTRQAIYTLNRSGKILSVNSGFERMIGLGQDDIIGRSINDFIFLKNSDLPIDSLDEEGCEGKNYLCFKGANSERRITLINEVPIYDNKRFLSLQVIATDVTEMKKLESQLKKANIELNRLATIDSLTNVANRREFDTFLKREWLIARRKKKSITLLMCDLDFFKGYNDTYGHQKGDDCLWKVAQTLKKNARRAGDLVARYGGEEFSVILIDIDPVKGEEIAEKMCRSINALKINNTASDINKYVSISIGVSSIIPTGSTTAKTLIQNADKALYEAKNKGRDQIKIF